MVWHQTTRMSVHQFLAGQLCTPYIYMAFIGSWHEERNSCDKHIIKNILKMQHDLKRQVNICKMVLLLR